MSGTIIYGCYMYYCVKFYFGGAIAWVTEFSRGNNVFILVHGQWKVSGTMWSPFVPKSVRHDFVELIISSI